MMLTVYLTNGNQLELRDFPDKEAAAEITKALTDATKSVIIVRTGENTVHINKHHIVFINVE